MSPGTQGNIVQDSSVVAFPVRQSSPLLLLVRICALFTAGIGLMAIVGWLIDQPVLASLGSDRIPVAPSTAALFVLYAFSIYIRSSFPTRGVATYWTGLSINAAGSLIALCLFILSIQGIQPEVEHLGVAVVNRPGETPVGHMSPVTAFCFLLSSLSYLLSLPSSRNRRWVANIAWWLACCIIVTGATLVLAYLYGTPMLYGSVFIPPAALTSMAFMALGTALLVLATPQAWSSRPDVESFTRASYTLLLVFVLLAAGIVVAGFLYYRNYEIRHRTEVEHQLAAIADLKVDELVHWRKERLGDAALFYKNFNFSGLVRSYLQQPEDKETGSILRTWLQHVQEGYQYDRVFLIDADGRERMSTPELVRPISSHLLQRAAEVLRTKQVVFKDFYRNEYDGRVYLAVLIPILDEPDNDRAVGTLVLRIDPEEYLYPFLKRWLTPSKTTETLLVRREGNEILFLNELESRKNMALNLRSSLDQKDLPAAQAVLGRQGIMEGRDYRDVPVLADLRAVPGSPWFLVSRMDISEIYGPVREKLWTTVALVIILLTGAGAVFGMVWRRQLAQFYRVKYEATAALRASEMRYRRLFETAQDGILILDAETGMVMDVNPFLVEMLGFSHEAFLGKKIWELGFFKDIVANQTKFEELQQIGYVRYLDLPLETADGRRIEVEFVSNVYQVNRQKVIQCNIRDITERKRVEDKLKETMADLQRSNKDLEQFAYVASHDLQEPLRMVASYTQLLAERYENQLDDKAKKFIHYAVDGAVRMQELINDLLTYSRIGTKGKPLEPTDLYAVLGEAVDNLKMNLNEAKAVITNDELPEVRADDSQMVQLFQNLIGNAVKFRGEEHPRVHISARDEGQEWLFSVSDNGIGMDRQYADKVFVIFQRLHTREEYPGSGIGLAICKKIVERHGGRIWFESEPGKGTTFHFTISK